MNMSRNEYLKLITHVKSNVLNLKRKDINYFRVYVLAKKNKLIQLFGCLDSKLIAPQILIFGVTREESNSILSLKNNLMVNSIQIVIINETDGWGTHSTQSCTVTSVLY